MCLAIPGKVIELHQAYGLRMARVEFGGITREACLEYLPEAGLGDFVLIHVGFAISRVDEEEAARSYAYLEEMDELAELSAAALELDQDVPG
jgi:hydrogenase expression/formation protein HypC